jgi:LPXTG-site transpeptidase (sortase) family protein
MRIGSNPLTVTINQAAAQADPTFASPINFTVVFSAPVTGFGDVAADVTLGGTAGATTALVTEIAPNDGTTYNVAVSGMSAAGTVSANVPAGAAVNGPSTGNLASTSTDNTVTFDIVPGTTTTLSALSDCRGVVTLTSTTTSGSAFPNSGSVNFYEGTTLLGTATINVANGKATFVTAALSSGLHSFRAQFLGTSGPSGYGGSEGAISITVTTGSCATPVTPTPQPKSNPQLPTTGFPKGEITTLPAQPADLAYNSLGAVWIEIPSLNVKANIVGVPQAKDGTWDVAWLDRNAGYLYGTAFPTWTGNSVITGHVWDANNKPGIFVDLKQLKFDDTFKIHAYGQVATYAVRESTTVSPSNTQSVLKHYGDTSWVTLLTCEDFNLLGLKYFSRRMVRAVLINLTAEK